MWLTFLENYIISRIEANAGHPDQLAWIKQALNIIALIGSAKLEEYAVPKLASWIKSAEGNPIEHSLVELAVAAIVTNGGEFGKIVGEAEALAEPPALNQRVVFGANAFNNWQPAVQEQVAFDPTPPGADAAAGIAHGNPTEPSEAEAPVETATTTADAEAAHDE